jgi:uncharacterized protein (UPF0276 family)
VAEIRGIGLGLRWDFLEEVADGPALAVDFFEVSPENHMSRGGYIPAALARVRDRYPIVTHGLTLSIGAIQEPDPAYLAALAAEIRRIGSPWHSDHLCFSSAGPRVLHDLLPLKLAQENVARVADRVRRVEDALGVPMALENISHYAHPGVAEMSETEFIGRIVEASGCALLLDVNNVYVNSLNHGFDPRRFIAELPLDRVVQIHVAGHERRGDLVIDTHGAAVCDPVFELLEWTLRRTGPRPVLLERDHRVPALASLLGEIAELRRIADRASVDRFERAASA